MTRKENNKYADENGPTPNAIKSTSNNKINYAFT